MRLTWRINLFGLYSVTGATEGSGFSGSVVVEDELVPLALFKQSIVLIKEKRAKKG